jgi:hypothetical protein
VQEENLARHIGPGEILEPVIINSQQNEIEDKENDEGDYSVTGPADIYGDGGGGGGGGDAPLAVS